MSVIGRMLTLIVVGLGLGASMAAGPAAAGDRAVKALRVEILKVKPESDGYTLDIRDDAGNVYRAVISPANIGPDSGFDFDHIKVGHRMIISGSAFMLGTERRITIRAAQAN